MVVRLYSVFDRVAQQFSPISEAVNDAVAYRMYKQALKDNPNREDYQVMFIGSFDNVKGVLSPVALPAVLEPGQLELELQGEPTGRMEIDK